MRYIVRLDDAVLGTVELPQGQLVAARLALQGGYELVRPLVRRATQAFLDHGLFYDPTLPGSGVPGGAVDWARAMHDASRLRITLIDARDRIVHSRFVNLLESDADGRVVVIANLAPGRRVGAG